MDKFWQAVFGKGGVIGWRRTDGTRKGHAQPSDRQLAHRIARRQLKRRMFDGW